MKPMVLTVVDTTGIQAYVFGTNSLQQNIGASYLVDCATRSWAIAALPGTHNVLNLDDPQNAFDSRKIENSQIDAEVVYAGGGNIVILFSTINLAQEFTRNLSRRVLLEAPGLKIVVVHKEFDWDSETLGSQSGVVQAAMRELAQKKAHPPVSVIQPGLAVTAACDFTGTPAVGLSQGNLVSAESLAKLECEQFARDRLTRLFNFHGFGAPPRNFDELGATKGEKSYLAIIHIDGNGMGARIERIRDHPDHQSPSGNRNYIEAQRAFSLSVQKAAHTAMQSTIDLLANNVEPDYTIGHIIQLSGNRLPFRPIVFGGDDTTFICDGRIGLSLAKHYIQEYSSQNLSDSAPAHCRAGISIVQSHYPFSRAYDLAEKLCSSAKEFILEQGDGISAMDWHYATSGVIFELKEIRQREYLVSDGDLTMRPIRITAGGSTWRTWSNFENVVTEFQGGRTWAGSHNKVKALRSALRSGEVAVNNFLKLYQIEALPQMANWSTSDGVAWHSDRCGYYDAVEIEDFYIPLS